MLCKRKSARDQNGVGYYPFPILGHCSGVAIGGPATWTAGLPTRKTMDLRDSTTVPRKAYRDRPPWVLCHDKECPVTTKMGCLMSRQSIQCRNRVWPFGVETHSWCRDKRAIECPEFSKDSCCDRVFLVSTKSARPQVVIEFLMS